MQIYYHIDKISQLIALLKQKRITQSYIRIFSWKNFGGKFIVMFFRKFKNLSKLNKQNFI